MIAQEFDDLLNGIVFELYFEKAILGKGLDVITLAKSHIPPIADLSGNELRSQISKTYNILHDPNSEIRARLIRQNIEVEEIRVINEALKK